MGALPVTRSSLDEDDAEAQLAPGPTPPSPQRSSLDRVTLPVDMAWHRTEADAPLVDIEMASPYTLRIRLQSPGVGSRVDYFDVRLGSPIGDLTKGQRHEVSVHLGNVIKNALALVCPNGEQVDQISLSSDDKSSAGDVLCKSFNQGKLVDEKTTRDATNVPSQRLKQSWCALHRNIANSTPVLPQSPRLEPRLEPRLSMPHGYINADKDKDKDVDADEVADTNSIAGSESSYHTARSIPGSPIQAGPAGSVAGEPIELA